MRKKILLIGANGFLGKEIFKKFIKNYKIVKFNNHKNKKDIRNKKFLQIVSNKYGPFDIIVNLSGQISSNLKKTKSINVDGTKNIIQVFGDKAMLICFSSLTIGAKTSTLSNVKKNYISSKKKMEEIVIKNTRNFKIIRLGNVYNDILNKKGLMKNLKLHFFSGKKFRLQNKTEKNYYVHVSDFLRIFDGILKKRSSKRIINIATEKYSNMQLYSIFKYFYDSNSKIKNKFILKSVDNLKNELFKPNFTLVKTIKNIK